MNFSGKRPIYLDYLFMVLGTGLMGIGIKTLFDPTGLVTGGFTGIAIIVKAYSEPFIEGGVPLWLANLILNIPVFLIALKMKGKRFIGRTTFSTLMLSLWLYLIPPIDISQGDFTIAALFGGVLCGIGIGLVLLARATTGGTDMVAVLIQKKLRHYSIVQIMQVLDGTIVLLGLYVFGLKAALYAIVAIFVATKVSDALMEGLKYSKSAIIITDQHEKISKEIMSQLDRGVTGLEAVGMYSGHQKTVLYSIVSKKEIIQLKELVAKIDPNAFVIVSDAREVLGEGFIEYSS
ncbi:MAG: YitT family protein [Lachnospiraceae bacterium]